MKDWTTITISANMSPEMYAELERRLPDLMESIGISEYSINPDTNHKEA